jgi:LacI family transcriptional regulator
MASNKQKRIVRKRERPLVLLSGLSRDTIEPMLELAREWEWDLRGTWISPDAWPPDRPFAGALIADLPTTPQAKRLRKTACPAVRIGARPHPRDDLLPAVLPDLVANGRLAAEHFSSRSFKQVAFVGHNPENPDANMHPVYVAFRQRADELGMTCHLLSLAELKGENASDRQARRTRELVSWLGGLPKPAGVFCFNDIMTEWVEMATAQAGLTVPEEVALLGYGNSMQCELAPVQLSSVDTALNERAKVAMRLLRRLMKGEPAPKAPIMVPSPSIVERRSTNVLAVADPTVARALRFMWDNFDQDLSVDDVAQEVGVNRRKLERGFRQSLGCTVRDELRRRRLDVACDLLRSTRDPIADIATKVGYRSSQYLHRAFRAAYNMTPRAYRLGREGE